MLTGTLGGSTRASLAWPTEYPNDLKAFKLEEVAAVARSGACTEPKDFIPIVLGNEDAVPRSLQVLVNTHGVPMTAVIRKAETGQTLGRSNCTRVNGTARVAFDARCVFNSVDGFPRHVQLRLEQVSRNGLQTEIVENVSVQLGE